MRWPLNGPDESFKNPWKGPDLGTMVGSSKWCLRRLLTRGDLVIRMMTGIEAMRAIGWELEDWVFHAGRGPASIYQNGITDELLLNLAGNAFSSYAFGPVAAATLACMGLSPEPEAAVVHSVSGSDESDDSLA